MVKWQVKQGQSDEKKVTVLSQKFWIKELILTICHIENIEHTSPLEENTFSIIISLDQNQDLQHKCYIIFTRAF